MEDFALARTKGTQKLTIVISKKVAGLAVDRNRIRRLFREAARGLNLENKIKIIVKKNISRLKKDQIQKSLEKLLKDVQ